MALAGLLAACSSDPASSERTAPVEVPPEDMGVIEIPSVDCPPQNPFCSSMAQPQAPTGPAPARQDCGDIPVDLTPAGVNIMVAVQGSPTMATHWSGIQTAIRSLYEGNPTAQFGLHVFWGEADDGDAMSMSNLTNNVCGPVHNDMLEVGAHTAEDLLGFLGSDPPGEWFTENDIPISPILEPLNYYLTNASTLADPTRTNYLVLISDGNDNCFGSFFVGRDDKLVAYQKVATELLKQGIRVIPIGFDAANSTVAEDPFGFRVGTDVTATNNAVLDTLLEYGGAALSEVPKVDDPSKLEAAVQQVGQRITNCRFELPAMLDPTTSVNPFALSFSINDQTIPRDRLHQNGWNFVDGGTSQIEMFGDACTAIQAGQAVQVERACGNNVCGTASVNVETRPRLVLLLLDSSASRIECVDGSLGCLSDPNSAGPDRPPTFWETVQHSIGASLTAPINDDVEFGIQFFPSKNAAAFSCEVEDAPEVPPAQGTEIAVMKAMLEVLPFGLSPVVGVMESVAANPGRLADPGVLGAVVMLSDGGENCATIESAQAASRLEAAAGQLLEMGVKTYAVRYGSEAGRTPEGDEQLTALVTAGGTAVVDPNDPSAKPYVDATTVDELAMAMADIADRLATCSFRLDGLPQGDTEKDNANLYLNGDVIPFDELGAMQDGWNWIDAERTTVELYGESCNAFKTNRRTSVVVEFGCPPIVVD